MYGLFVSVLFFLFELPSFSGTSCRQEIEESVGGNSFPLLPLARSCYCCCCLSPFLSALSDQQLHIVDDEDLLSRLALFIVVLLRL